MTNVFSLALIGLADEGELLESAPLDLPFFALPILFDCFRAGILDLLCDLVR